MANIKLFESKKIRSVWNEQEQKWYFSVADVVEALTDSIDVKQYIKRLRQRDNPLNSNWGTICTPLEMVAADGKKRKIQAANVEGLLRIIQSIPSPKAEPFKLWLAKVGQERLEEIENPELAQKRMREIRKVRAFSPARDGIFIKNPNPLINQSPVGTKWRMIWQTHSRNYISILFLQCRIESPLFKTNGKMNYINT